MAIPSDRSYTADHEWIKFDGDVARVGITAHAADALGDIVFVDPPQVGDELTAGEACGEIESTKSVSDLVAPASGEVVEVNDAVVDAPETVNADPYEQGWIYALRVSSQGQTLDAAAYTALLESEA